MLIMKGRKEGGREGGSRLTERDLVLMMRAVSLGTMECFMEL